MNWRKDIIRKYNSPCVPVPMRAILNGLTAPGVWSTEPVHLGIGNLISSLTRYNITNPEAEQKTQNLAVISRNYMNLTLRLGYHFNVIDTFVSDSAEDNYIYFRFVGGVTNPSRRHRRALLLQEILEKLNFLVVVNGDLVVGRLKKWEKEKQLSILETLGKLIGFSRQLDTQMLNDEAIDKYAAIFLEKIRNLSF